MHNEVKQRTLKQNKRKMRVRKHLRGTSVKPRLCVFKSNAHISAQLIDDEKGVTLVGFGSYSKEIKTATQGKAKKRNRYDGWTKAWRKNQRSKKLARSSLTAVQTNTTA